MANPQRENGHIQTATEIQDALCRTRIPGQARQVFDFIVRKTWGWNKKHDEIALEQFVKATGLSKPNVIESRAVLIKMNLIVVTEKGNGIATRYAIQKDYEKWKPLPKKIALPKKVTTVTEKGNSPLPKKVTPIITTDTSTTDTLQKTVSRPDKPADLSKEFIEKAKRADQLGFNVYKQVNRYSKGKCNSIPEQVMNEILDEFFKYREKIKDIFPYMARVIQEKSRRYFSEKNVAEHEAIKKQPVVVGDILRQLAGAMQ